MGDKISQLPAATSVDGTEIVPIVQGGATKKVTGLILRNPAGPASGDLTGNYPNPTLAAITTAQTVGSATQIPVVTVDTKGRVTGVTTAANPQGTVTSVVGGTGLTGGTITSTGTLAVSYGTTAGTAAQGNDSRFSTIPAPSATLPSPDGTAAVGVSSTFARADHVHERQSVALTGDVTGSGVGSIPTSLAPITTAQTNIGSGTQIPVISVDAKGRVTALSSVAASAPVNAITALTGDVTAAGPGSAVSALATITTAQTNVGSSTTVPIISVDAKGRVTALGSTPFGSSAGGTVTSITAGTGLSGGTITASGTLAVNYGTTAGTATEGNDSRLSDSRTPSGAAGGDLTGNYPNPTLATVTTAQTAVGNSTTIPVITVNAKGQITALTTAAAAGGVALATTAPANLASVAAVGTGTTAARADHQHAFPTASDVGALGATAAAGGDLTGSYPGPTLAAITTAQSNVGSATQIPILSIDAKGRVTALSSVAASFTYSASVLIIAGGGGGGSRGSGGGGGGGFRSESTSFTSGTNYSVTVGAGGPGKAGPTLASGDSGSNSEIIALISLGGGGGGAFDVNGVAGGSGGGAGQEGTVGGTQLGGSGTVGQGNNGGNGVRGAGSPGNSFNAGGGGGAGAAGANATISPNAGGAGGAGLSSSISGTSYFYAGGGGGGQAAGSGGIGGNGGSGGGGGGGGGTGGVGGTGGTANGGAGGSGVGGAGGNGGVNTGGGGGGCVNDLLGGNPFGGNGGSGVVVISYAGAQRGTGGTVTSVGGNTIHTFTSSGTYVA